MKILGWTLGAGFLGWVGFWFWAFSFASSSSFFQYDLGTRLPFFLLALLAVTVPPLSGYRVLTAVLCERCSKVKAGLAHLAVTAAPLLLFWGVFAAAIALARRSGGIAFEADDAMGIGINFMLCVAVFVAFNLVVTAVLFCMHLFGRKHAVA